MRNYDQLALSPPEPILKYEAIRTSSRLYTKQRLWIKDLSWNISYNKVILRFEIMGRFNQKNSRDNNFMS